MKIGRHTQTYLLGWLLIFLTSSAIRSQTVDSSPEDWQWQDSHGEIHRPWSDSQTQAIVAIFVTTDCPIANAYQPEIRRLAERFGPRGIRFYLFYPGLQVDDPAINDHRKEYQIDLPSIGDPNHKWVKQFEAAVTPQAIVFRRGESKPAYTGRIDDRFADYGKRRAQPTSQELSNALESIEAGAEVLVPVTEAIGCQIESPSSWATLVQPISIANQETNRQSSDKYIPAQPNGREAEQLELSFVDKKRDREIPLRVYLPKDNAAAPVILFSHGLGGNRNGSKFLGNHWAQQGYLAVFMQHPGSDETVWRDAPLRERMAAMKQAANGKNLLLRIADVPVVIDQLTTWNRQSDHPMAGRLDLDRLGMAGHSFGAVTTQAVSGQTAIGRALGTDPRIKAALILSPSSPRAGKPAAAFGTVKLPWMLMTGTDDLSPIGDIDMESRLAVYPALPTGHKYELVLDGAQHSVFNDRELLPRSQPNKPAHHKTIMQLSTAFWDAYLREQASAKQWLQGEGPREIMDKNDRWQSK